PSQGEVTVPMSDVKQPEAPAAVDIKDLVLADNAFGPAEVKTITTAIAGDYAQYRVLREAVQQLELRENLGPAGHVRLGVCYYLMGRYTLATNTLERGDGGALNLYYQAKTALAQEKFPRAAELYKAAAAAGYDNNSCM